MSPEWLAAQRTIAHRLPVADKLEAMLALACSFGTLQRNVNGEWLSFPDACDVATHILVKDLAREHLNPTVRDCVTYHETQNTCTYVMTAGVAKIVCSSLWGTTSTLWALLLYLTGGANMGMRLAAITGPVGSGKSYTLVAFASLLLTVSDATVVLLCAANSPLGDKAKLAYSALNNFATVFCGYVAKCTIRICSGKI